MSLSAHSSGNSEAKIASLHLVQLGLGNGRVEGAPLDGLGQLSLVDAEPAGQLESRGNASMRMDM